MFANDFGIALPSSTGGSDCRLGASPGITARRVEAYTEYRRQAMDRTHRIDDDDVSIGGPALKNPWLKKNPWMSMWLSGANAMMGGARRRIATEAHRQAATAMSDATRQAFTFWSGPLQPKPAKRRKRR
jgi:hypothetical protein